MGSSSLAVSHRDVLEMFSHVRMVPLSQEILPTTASSILVHLMEHAVKTNNNAMLSATHSLSQKENDHPSPKYLTMASVSNSTTRLALWKDLPHVLDTMTMSTYASVLIQPSQTHPPTRWMVRLISTYKTGREDLSLVEPVPNTQETGQILSTNDATSSVMMST